MDRLQMALYVFSIKATIDLSLALLSQSTAYFSKLQSARPKDTEGLEFFLLRIYTQSFFSGTFFIPKNRYF